MKKFDVFVNESKKSFNQKREELEEYKKGSIVVFKSVYISGVVQKNIYEIRVGEIIGYNFDYSVYMYLIDDIIDNGQWMVPKSRVKRLATDREIENYKMKEEAKKFNI